MTSKIEKLEKLLSEATAGPWHIKSKDEDDREWPEIKSSPDQYNPYGVHIAEMKSFDFENAQLICALRNCAPLLLEIVKTTMESHGAPEYDKECDICQAIKKF